MENMFVSYWFSPFVSCVSPVCYLNNSVLCICLTCLLSELFPHNFYHFLFWLFQHHTVNHYVIFVWSIWKHLHYLWVHIGVCLCACVLSYFSGRHWMMGGGGTVCNSMFSCITTYLKCFKPLPGVVCSIC